MKKILLIILTLIILINLISCEDQSENNNYNNANSNKIENLAEQMKIVTPTVYFDTAGGSYIEPIKTNLIEYEPITHKNDYYFDGWYLDSTLNVQATFPMEIKHDTKLYAKWLLINYSDKSDKTKKIDSNLIETKGFSYNITPEKFNLTRLAELGFNIKITVTYDAYYSKTYDVLWDIGYLGAPKFETYIKKSGITVKSKENIEATKSGQRYEISYNTTASDLKDDSVIIEFWSDNIQNAIYFENINIKYQCYK